MRRSLAVGYCVLTLAQVAISVNVVTSKFLVANIPMFFILAARFTISTILLGGMLFLTHTPLKDPCHPQGKLTTHDWFLAILQGIFAAVLFNVFFLWGLQHTTATISGIIGSTLPAIVALSAIWLLNERMNSAKIMALVLAMLGVFVINLDHLEGGSALTHSYLGDFLVFLAMFPEAWYSIIMRKLANRFTPLGSAFLANVVGVVSFLPCAIFSDPAFHLEGVTLDQWGFISIAGLTSLLFFWCWGWGLTFIPASTAGIFGGVMPVATTLLAILFLGESLRWYDIIGMLLVLASILLGTGLSWGPKKILPTSREEDPSRPI